MRFPNFKSNGKLNMRDSLFGYMMILTVVILIVIAFGLMVLGTFSEPSDVYTNMLELHMEVFEKDIVSHNEELSMRGANLSANASRIIAYYLRTNALDFSDLQNSPEHISALEKIFADMLDDEILKARSFGIFIMLDTAREYTDASSKAGVYLRRSSYDRLDESLLLYRGISSVGNDLGILPSDNWNEEFDINDFPDFSDILQTDPAIPLEKSYVFARAVAIPGVNENAMLIAVPIRGNRGEVWGICGFEINEQSFRINHAQSATVDHLMCMWFPSLTDLSASSAMICGTSDGYFAPPQGQITKSNAKGNLCVFNAENGSFIGLSRVHEFDNGEKHTFAVMIPKGDYDKAVSTNSVQIVIFLILLSFFAISLCRILSKRFINPIIDGLERIRMFEHSGSVSHLSEISDLFAFLAAKDREYEMAYESLADEKEKAQTELTRVQREIEKLCYSRKNEIDPDDYENFVIGIKMLTKSERNIFEMYLAGKTAKEIIEITGIKESTLKFHNSNIYEKLGVSSRKQMLRYAALYTNDNSVADQV